MSAQGLNPLEALRGKQPRLALSSASPRGRAPDDERLSLVKGLHETDAQTHQAVRRVKHFVRDALEKIGVAENSVALQQQGAFRLKTKTHLAAVARRLFSKGRKGRKN